MIPLFLAPAQRVAATLAYGITITTRPSWRNRPERVGAARDEPTAPFLTRRPPLCLGMWPCGFAGLAPPRVSAFLCPTSILDTSNAYGRRQRRTLKVASAPTLARPLLLMSSIELRRAHVFGRVPGNCLRFASGYRIERRKSNYID